MKYIVFWWTTLGFTLNRIQCTVSRREGAGAVEKPSSPVQPERKSKKRSTAEEPWGSLCGTVLLHSSSRTGRWKWSCGWSAGMHRLWTTVARLRPLTTTQTAQSLSQPRLLVIEGGLRTFQPPRHLNTSVTAEPFLNGTSSNYVEEMYYAWLENPKNVHKVLYAWKICVPLLWMPPHLLNGNRYMSKI